MQLFAINRYDNENQERDDTKENEKLQKLLKKAEKKKRKLQKEKEESKEAEPQEDVEPPKKHRGEDVDPKPPTDPPTAGDGDKEPAEATKQPENESKSEFQVLGMDKFDKKEEAKMVLPPWLRFPTIIVNEIASASADLDDYAKILSPVLIKNLKSKDMTKLFPVQKEVIPWILDAHSKPAPFRPRDICISAPTGSGKTLAFALPIVQLLMDRVECKVRALVVLPAIELAQQVYNVFKTLTKNTVLKVGLLSTTMPFKMEQNFIVDKFKDEYFSKLDIVVTTPGRLVEHLHSTKGFVLKSLRFLVIDEADRMMEQSHHNWLYHLDEHLKSTAESFMTGRSIPLCLHQLETQAWRQPHKMLFSATLTQDPEKLQNLRLFQPKLFTSIVKSAEEFVNQLMMNASKQQETTETQGDFIGKYTTPAELSEYTILTQMRYKPLTLFALLEEHGWKKFLCFTNTTQAANRLSYVLNELSKNLKIADLSAALKPGDRKKVLSDFSKGNIHGLICSDALARGIDISNVDVVISYEVPRHIKTYIHRVGRTARAGKKGTAITILTHDDKERFNKILKAGEKDQVPEMKASTELEERHAKRYMKALNSLQAWLKEIDERDAAKKSKVRTNKEELTIMDRLQNEIDEKMEEQISAPTIPKSLARKEKQLNRRIRKKHEKTE